MIQSARPTVLLANSSREMPLEMARVKTRLTNPLLIGKLNVLAPSFRLIAIAARVVDFQLRNSARRSAGGRRFPIKCGNGLLCDLRTRSTEQWGQAEAVTCH